MKIDYLILPPIPMDSQWLSSCSRVKWQNAFKMPELGRPEKIWGQSSIWCQCIVGAMASLAICGLLVCPCALISDVKLARFRSSSQPHRIHGAAIYGNIYHQYTPNVSIYNPMGTGVLWFYLICRLERQDQYGNAVLNDAFLGRLYGCVWK
jgi:hypothetical protein